MIDEPPKDYSDDVHIVPSAMPSEPRLSRSGVLWLVALLIVLVALTAAGWLFLGRL